MTDITDLEAGQVTVVFGSETNSYNLGGRTIADARRLLDELVFGGQLHGLVVLLNGQRMEDTVLGEGTVLEADDVVTFLGQAGRKG